MLNVSVVVTKRSIYITRPSTCVRVPNDGHFCRIKFHARDRAARRSVK